MARNYQQGKVYLIMANNEDCLPYISSTCKRLLSQRMSSHHQDYKKWAKDPEKYSKPFCPLFNLFEKYGFENCYIELIEIFPCNSKNELKTRERRWINDIKCINNRGN